MGLSPQQSGSATPILAVIASITAIILAVIAPVTPVVVPVIAPFTNLAE
jgi:hypothetical protein